MTEYRVEHDSMGEVRVPASARYGAQTQRAVENFPVSGGGIDVRLIRALARIKGAAALVNARLTAVQAVDEQIGDAIAAAAAEVVAGRWDDQFPVDVFQTGSGTSSNMNMNEVLASLASEHLGQAGAVHPNDHVNASQSSNDVFPSAVHLAVVEGMVRDLVPALDHLVAALDDKAAEFGDVVKAGRTHLMDATPVTLGQEFAGYAAQVKTAIERLDSGLERVGRLPLGGTATGTGLNCPPGFAAGVIERIAAETGLPVREAPDHFEAQAARDGLVEASGHMRTLAVALVKIANDLRWMGSGPATGLAEIRIPDLQPGSSIMPGKVNPVIPEAVCQVVAQVIGNDAAVAFAGSQGNFELNVMIPVMARNTLESVTLLANVSRLLADRCIAGLEADQERCRRNAESTPALATALNPYIGYEEAARVVKTALASGRTVREVVLSEGLMDDDQVDQVLDVRGMAEGGLR